MKINLTTFRHWDNTIVTWLNKTFGSCTSNGEDGLFADTWRIYHTQHTVEGFYETTFWLEFDNDADGTMFLLKYGA